jgi:hypothetical protein
MSLEGNLGIAEGPGQDEEEATRAIGSSQEQGEMGIVRGCRYEGGVISPCESPLPSNQTPASAGDFTLRLNLHPSVYKLGDLRPVIYRPKD